MASSFAWKVVGGGVPDAPPFTEHVGVYRAGRRYPPPPEGYRPLYRKKNTPAGVFFLCHFVWKYRIPSVRGPQWLETVQPARVCSTSSKG